MTSYILISGKIRNMAESIEKQLRARKKAYDTNNLCEAASICNNIGVYYTGKGEHEKALRYHREELQLSESLNDKLGQAVAHRKVGECLADMCQFKKAIEEQNLYLEISKSLDNLQEKQRAHATLGRVWYMRYKAEENERRDNYLQKSKDAFMLSLTECDKLESEGVVRTKELCDMRARLYLNLGLLAEEKGEVMIAEEQYQKASQLGKESGAHSLIWQCHYNLGDLLLHNNQPNRALIIFEESLNYVNKTDKRLRADSLMQMAMICIDMVELDTAKKYLKSVIKLNCLSDEENDSVLLKYKTVRKILNLKQEADNISPSSIQEKIKLYDRLGDLCSHKDIQFYSAALKFYRTELELAETHGYEPKDVSSILFSLAETHCDKCEYKQSLEYYHKELITWCNQPTESAVTYCNIAHVQEAANEDWTVVMETYNKSIELARTSGSYKVLADVLRDILVYCEDIPETRAERESIKNELDSLQEEHPDINLIKVENDDDSIPLNSEELNEELILSSSDSDDEEDAMLIETNDNVPVRQLRGVALRKKSKVMKRNEKGETLLHVACIEGNLPRVEQLINDGADINARDHCGWTPLHEACNHGHLNIVECLIKYGSFINDPGGIHCHKTTPLMDAAVNGHTDIVSLLIKSGADLMKRNDKKQTALSLIEEILSNNSGSTLNSEPYELYDEHVVIKQLLIQEMTSNRVINDVCSKTDITLKQTTCGHISSSVSTTPVAIVHPLLHTRENIDVPALIPELSDDELQEQDIYVPITDNWLINDMQPPKKRRRSLGSGDGRSFSSEERRSIRSGDRIRNVTHGGDHTPRRRVRLNRTVTTNTSDDTERTHSPVIQDDDVIDNDITTPLSPVGETSVVFNTSTTASDVYYQMIRITVHVENTSYLIPCPRYNNGDMVTVNCLTEKVSERYVMQYGRRPVIQLTTKSGALLCPSDPIEGVIQDGEELRGVVSHWDTPPLHEHYIHICDKFKTVTNKRILRLLQTNPNPLTLDMSNIGLHSSHCHALFHSLLPQSTLTSLILSGNRIMDSSISHLCSLLNHLSVLRTLDLKCTGITYHSLITLSQCQTDLSIQYLVLSHNHFGPSCGSALSLFLSRCPALVSLHLDDCDITSYTLESHTGLCDTLKTQNSLRDLSLSCNPLDDSGYKLLQPVLNTITLSNINMAASSMSSLLTIQPLIKSTLVHLDMSFCSLGDIGTSSLSSLLPSTLQYLSLSGNNITSISVPVLTRFLYECKSLKHFDVSGNRLLGNNGTLSILKSCSSQVNELVLRDCGMMSLLSPDIYTFIMNCKFVFLDMSDNGINDSEKETIASLWRQRCNGSVCIYGNMFLMN